MFSGTDAFGQCQRLTGQPDYRPWSRRPQCLRCESMWNSCSWDPEGPASYDAALYLKMLELATCQPAKSARLHSSPSSHGQDWAGSLPREMLGAWL